MKNIGIDYGMGKSNIDLLTEIRYGVISQHSVMSEALNDMELQYGDPHCPKCGNDAEDIVNYTNANPDVDIEEWERKKYDSEDYVCLECKLVFGSESAFSAEPQGFSYEKEGYCLIDCLNSDIFVLKSPFYTFAQFCSPCVPGAGNLDSPMKEGVKCYALGHDWFEGGKSPYPVYSVDTERRVLPKAYGC